LSIEQARLVRVVAALGAGHLLLGLAHIATLPPWEGFDEFAHYSYVQEIADTGSVPRLSTARLSADVERYAQSAPLPYSAAPPFESNGGLTYYSFFRGSEEAVGRGRGLVHERPLEPRRFAPTAGINWQAQHPPLYYLVLAPVYRATRDLGWGLHLFSLRLLSYALAWTAWVLAVCGCLRMAASAPAAARLPWHWAALGTAIWPVAFPGWFPEFARLGNDSLCALLATAVWWLAIHAAQEGLSARHAVGFGLLLGAGALTKGLFLPIGAGLVAFWLLRAWRSGGREEVLRTGGRAAMTLLVAAAIAGWWWYGADSQPYGYPLRADELRSLGESGGLTAGLLRNATLRALVRGHAALVTTVAWAGTWSLARPPYLFLLPLAATALLVSGGYLWTLRRRGLGDVAWLPFWMVAPVLAGLSGHALVRIGLGGQAITPGYYLHVLLAPLGFALGMVLAACFPQRTLRAGIGLLGAYALGFAAAITWAQVLMFTGHLVKTGSDKFYRMGSPWAVLFDVPSVLQRLGVLGYPLVGAIAFVLGGSLVLVGALYAWRIARLSGLPASPGA
jgi:hypothetical protein